MAHVCFSTYVIERSPESFINDMKPTFYKKFFKSKKRSLGSKHRPGPATSASDATARGGQVTAGVSVSVQLRTSHLWSIDLIVIKQTTHDLAVSTSVSALEINDIPPVSFPATGVNLVHHILYPLNHRHRLDCLWRRPSLYFGICSGDKWSCSSKCSSHGH